MYPKKTLSQNSAYIHHYHCTVPVWITDLNFSCLSWFCLVSSLKNSPGTTPNLGMWPRGAEHILFEPDLHEHTMCTWYRPGLHEYTQHCTVLIYIGRSPRWSCTTIDTLRGVVLIYMRTLLHGVVKRALSNPWEDVQGHRGGCMDSCPITYFLNLRSSNSIYTSTLQ